jgi:family 2 glycosyl transferase
MLWYEEIMETAQEAVDYIAAALQESDGLTVSVRQVLTDFCTAMDGVAEYLSRENGTLVEKCRRYALNAAHSGTKALAAETHEETRTFFFYEVRPLFLDLRWQLDLEYQILRHPENEEAYLSDTLAAFEAARKRPRRTGFKYRVSIIVPAYNKVEFSRCAIESLFRHTDFSHGDIELITINDGSSDETGAYFDSLPHEKKINLKYNVYNHLGWGIARHIVEGEYVVYFSNDAVATPHWLENLLAVHAAEQDVFWVVPTCNSNCISNAQGIPVDYPNTFEAMGEMETFAARHNVSDPLLWEERAVLMPFVSVVPNLFDVPEIRADYRYTMCDFEDDDFSTTLRRSGFRQILAKDTFVHHFGGVTLNDVRSEQENYKSLISMRPVFHEKWKVDPWEARGHLYFMDEFLKTVPEADSPVRALVIEPMFGEGILSIRNYFRKLRREVAIDAVVTDVRYLEDVRSMTDRIVQTDTLDHLADEVHEHYDIIIAAAQLNDLPVRDILSFFQICHERLRPHGFVYASLHNYNSFEHTMESLPNQIPYLVYDTVMPLDGRRIYPTMRLVAALRERFTEPSVQIGYVTGGQVFNGMESFAESVYAALGTPENDRAYLRQFLSGNSVIFHIRAI